MMRRWAFAYAGVLATAMTGLPASADDMLRCEAWPGGMDEAGTTVAVEVYAFPDRQFSGTLKLVAAGGGPNFIEGKFRFPAKGDDRSTLLLRSQDSLEWRVFLRDGTKVGFRDCSSRPVGAAADADKSCGAEKDLDTDEKARVYLFKSDVEGRAKQLKKLHCRVTLDGLVSLFDDDDKVAGKDDDADDSLVDGKDVKVLDKDGKEVPPLIDPDKRAEGDARPDPDARNPKSDSLSDLLAGGGTPKDDGKSDGAKKGDLTALLSGGEDEVPKSPGTPEKPADKAEDKSLKDLTVGEEGAPKNKDRPLTDLTVGRDDKIAAAGPEKSDAPKKRPAKAEVAGASTGSVCEIVDHGRRFVLASTPARGLSDKISAIFAGYRSDKTEAPGYEVDTVTSEVFETDQVLSLGPTREMIIAYKVQGRGVPDGAAERDLPRAYVAFEDLGRDGKAPAEEVDFSLPPVNVMVFGGASETAYSGLAAVEKFMKTAGKDYRLNIEYYKLTRKGVFAAPKTYPSFKSLILSTEPYRGNPPWVNLRAEQFKPYFEAIAARLEESAMERVDHIVLLKGPYSLPDSAISTTKGLLETLSTSPKVNRDYKFLSVVAARGSDFSHGYLAQPVTEYWGSEFFYEPEGVNAAREKSGKNPQLLGEADQKKLGQALETRFQGTAKKHGGGKAARATGKFAVSSADVFDTMGLAVSIDALEEMSLKASDLLSLYAEVATAGPATGKKIVDHRKLPRRTSLIDALSPTESGLSARYVTPRWLSRPIVTLDADQAGQAFAKLDGFKALIGRVLSTVEARNCGLVYIPLNADYTAIGGAK